MKNILFSILFSSCFFVGFGQSHKLNLKVLGSCPSGTPRIGQTITIKLVVDRNKCDPMTGFVSMEDKVFHFEEALRAKGIQFSEFNRSIKSGTSGTVDTEIYSYDGDDSQIEDVIEIAKNQQIKINNLRNRYEPRTLEDQDESAICALQEATRKAEYIAKSLGYENCELTSVDDDSSGAMSLEAMLMAMTLQDFGDSSGSSYSIIGYFEVY